MQLRTLKFPSSGYRSPLLSYWTVVVLTAFLLAYTVYRVGFGAGTGDTMSYFESGDLLFSGDLDDVRPPVYPIVLHLLKAVFGFEGSRNAASILQIVLFAITIVYVNKTLRLLAPKHPRLCFWMTLMFILLQTERWHGLWWVMLVISDLFAIAFAAFLTYCILRAAQSDVTTYRYAVWTSVWLLLLVFCRPVMLCFVPVVLFFWFVLYLKFRRDVWRKCLIGVGGVALTVVLIGVYAYGLNKRYGIHSVSFVGSANNYALLRYAGLITPEDTDDPTFKAFLEKHYAIKSGGITTEEQGLEMELLRDSPREFHCKVEQVVNHVIQSHPKVVARAILNRYREVNDPYVSFVNMLISVVVGVAVAFYYKYRQISPVPWTLFLFVLSLWFSVFIGANADWQRLSLPMTPMLTLLVGWALSLLRVVPQECKTKNDDYHESK